MYWITKRTTKVLNLLHINLNRICVHLWTLEKNICPCGTDSQIAKASRFIVSRLIFRTQGVLYKTCFEHHFCEQMQS